MGERHIAMKHTYRVQYYGLLADRRGVPGEVVNTTAATPAEVYREVDAAHPLGVPNHAFRAVVNDEFVSWDHILRDGDCIAFLPPMSGG